MAQQVDDAAHLERPQQPQPGCPPAGTGWSQSRHSGSNRPARVRRAPPPPSAPPPPPVPRPTVAKNRTRHTAPSATDRHRAPPAPAARRGRHRRWPGAPSPPPARIRPRDRAAGRRAGTPAPRRSRAHSVASGQSACAPPWHEPMPSVGCVRCGTDGRGRSRATAPSGGSSGLQPHNTGFWGLRRMNGDRVRLLGGASSSGKPGGSRYGTTPRLSALHSLGPLYGRVEWRYDGSRQRGMEGVHAGGRRLDHCFA